MPVITLNNVVFPAPFGPMMALRSPGMIASVTSRTACRPPKLLQRPFNSRIGVTLITIWPVRKKLPGPQRGAPAFCGLLAVLAGRKVAVIDRLGEELLLAVGPELADLRIGLDHGVPELVLVVAEHLLLLDFFDVDVLDRVTHVVEFDRPARCVEFDARHQLDELLRPRKFTAGLLHRFVDPHGGAVVVFRVVARNLAELGAIGLHESLVRWGVDRRAVV